MNCPCSAGHKQDRQPYPVDPYFAESSDHAYIHDRYQVYTYRHLVYQNENIVRALITRFCSASILAACDDLLRFGSVTTIHTNICARVRSKTLDVNFEISNYFTAVVLLIASEASF